ncbi:ComF family protein [Aldersonia kunmingensis]|uniref:ComF family protein n=1 Tax=Aldersonia kunmingensis TaxID=408066 RepID=UPI00083617FA|nr:phosphoribosyltransferase family protein [Aldersonia kunmingensis]
MRALLDLVLPLECGGCGLPGAGWCAACARELAGHPVALRPRVDPGVPCWALGAHSGARRNAVIAMKERRRRDLADPLGTALAEALAWLREVGHLDPDQFAPLVLIPAPTRARAARRRGGDPVTAMARVAARRLPGCSVVPALRLSAGARDSVGLSPQARRANVDGRVSVRVPGATIGPGANVVVVDDVVTTGATLTESVRTLCRAGVPVSGAIVIVAAR